MKLAVHWAPSVNTWTPGWTVAVAGGAHAGAAAADGRRLAPERAVTAAAAAAESMTERVRMLRERARRGSLAVGGRFFQAQARRRASASAAMVRTMSAAGS